MTMQCLILAGGPGTRMRPMTERAPKSLLPVNGVPFAHHQLDWLAAEGVTRVVYSIGYLGSMIRDSIGDGARWGLDAVYVDEGEDLLGSAGAIRLAMDRNAVDEKFMVLYGDSYLPIQLSPIWEKAVSAPDPTMTVFRNEGRWDDSNVVFEDGKVTLYEKGRQDQEAINMRHIDYGLSVLNRGVIAGQVASGEKADLADVFHQLSIEGRLLGHEVHERFFEIGSPEGLKELEAYLGPG